MKLQPEPNFTPPVSELYQLKGHVEATLEAVKAYATFGEIYSAMRQVYGSVATAEIHSACVQV